MRSVHRSREGRTSLVLLATVLVISSMAWNAEAQGSHRSPTASGDRLWGARYNGPGNGDDAAQALGVSPDGSTVFVTGSSTGATSRQEYATAAYDAATGARVWGARSKGPGTSTALGVSPDGSAVFVTGTGGEYPDHNYVTLAYDASTGAQLWRARYNGPGDGTDQATALGVSPDGSTVFVTGESEGSDIVYATVAHDAATGALLWVARYTGPGVGFWDVPNALGVSADGSAVFITGESTEAGGSTYFDYATVAYDAGTGDRLWVARYDSHNSDDVAHALGVSPDGSAVYVTGFSFGAERDYLTIAYDAATGARLWGTRYTGPNEYDIAYALGVSPDGSAVYVTGQSGEYGDSDYFTLGLDAATGALRWGSVYIGPGDDEDVAYALAVSPDGSAVFVTGYSDAAPGLADNRDYLTVAYDAATGIRLWEARQDSPADGIDIARAVGVSPDSSAVFVTGESGEDGNSDYVTIAYEP